MEIAETSDESINDMSEEFYDEADGDGDDDEDSENSIHREQ